MQKIIPFSWFEGKAEEAANFSPLFLLHDKDPGK